LARIAIMALVSILSAVLFLVLLYTHVIHYFSQPEAGYEPAWSPDGSHIAYTGLFADRQSVFVLNTQTGDQHNLFPVTLQPHIRPAWARDGKAIIWLTNPTRRIGMSIVGYDAAAGSVTSEPFEFWCCEAEDPTGYSAMYDAARLSPDGRWLVFSRDTDRTDSVIIRDLYLIEMPGDLLQNPRQLRSINLTNTPGLDESSPDWRPDSQLIVYSRITSESNQSELWTVDRTTGVRERLGNINGEAPRWSPDSQWIAYTSSSAGNYDIMLVRPDGSDQVNLTGQNRSNQFMPDWSPDSRQLVYTSWDTGASHLWVMAVDGSNPRNLTVEAQRSASNRFAQLLVPVGIVLLCGLLLFLPRNWLRPVRKK
jgi:TolB protein